MGKCWSIIINSSTKAQSILIIITLFSILSGSLFASYTFIDSRLEKKINKIFDKKIQSDVISKLDHIIDSLEDNRVYREKSIIRAMQKQVDKIEDEKFDDIEAVDISSCLEDYQLIKIKNGEVEAYYNIIYAYRISSKSHKK